MKRWVRIAAALAACAFLSGCAASRPEAKKEEPPGLSVRLPIADAATLNIESEPSFATPGTAALGGRRIARPLAQLLRGELLPRETVIAGRRRGTLESSAPAAAATWPPSGRSGGRPIVDLRFDLAHLLTLRRDRAAGTACDRRRRLLLHPGLPVVRRPPVDRPSVRPRAPSHAPADEPRERCEEAPAFPPFPAPARPSSSPRSPGLLSARAGSWVAGPPSPSSATRRFSSVRQRREGEPPASPDAPCGCPAAAARRGSSGSPPAARCARRYSRAIRGDPAPRERRPGRCRADGSTARAGHRRVRIRPDGTAPPAAAAPSGHCSPRGRSGPSRDGSKHCSADIGSSRKRS